jgi:hypothetical protein
MSYKLLLEVLPLPNEIVDIIHEFMKVNAANVIVAYFTNAKRRYNVFVYLSHYSIEYISEQSIYSINSIYNANFALANGSNAKDKVIEDLHKHLVFMYGAHYSRTKYKRDGWANVLGNVSQILMYYYNRLAFSDSLKKKNSNYVYLKACIQLWFKLCQKYNLYLVLCYLESAKRVNRNAKAIKLRTIKNFAEFRLAPLVTYAKMPDSIYNECGLMRHHKLLRLNALERQIY